MTRCWLSIRILWASGDLRLAEDGGEVWVRELADGSKAVGLFNRGNKEAA